MTDNSRSRKAQEYERLLLGIVQRRNPELLAAAERLNSSTPPHPHERDALGEVLLDELTSQGLDPSDEPTRYGLVVEELLDWLRTV